MSKRFILNEIAIYFRFNKLLHNPVFALLNSLLITSNWLVWIKSLSNSKLKMHFQILHIVKSIMISGAIASTQGIKSWKFQLFFHLNRLNKFLSNKVLHLGLSFFWRSKFIRPINTFLGPKIKCYLSEEINLSQAS